MYYTDPITGVIVIESSPEPDPEPKPVKSNGGRKKNPVIKPPVPLYAEIRKMQWPQVKWWIDHYMYGEVKNIDSLDVITLQNKLQDHIQKCPKLKMAQNYATVEAKEAYENAMESVTEAKEVLTKKRQVADELVMQTKRTKNELAELKRDFPTLDNTHVCFSDTKFIINAKSDAAAELAKKARLAVKEVREREDSLKRTKKEAEKLVY